MNDQSNIGVCPLKPNEWVQFIRTQQNLHLQILYSEIQYALTRIIIMIALYSFSFSIFSINMMNFSKGSQLLIITFFLGVMIVIAIWILKYYSLIRKLRKNIVINSIGNGDLLIEKILNGVLKESEDIRGEYAKIMIVAGMGLLAIEKKLKMNIK